MLGRLAAAPALRDLRVVTTEVSGCTSHARRRRWPRPGGGWPGRERTCGRYRRRRRALDEAQALARAAGGPLVVAGSLYLVGGGARMAHAHADACGARPFAWGARTYVMGILNVTPDSFSGDGLLHGCRRRPAAGRRGPGAADGRRRAPTCSTSAANRPVPVTPRSTRQRSWPGSCRSCGPIRAALPAMPLSIDTTKVAVARAALDAGADLLNDVGGGGTGRCAPRPPRRRARRPATS